MSKSLIIWIIIWVILYITWLILLAHNQLTIGILIWIPLVFSTVKVIIKGVIDD